MNVEEMLACFGLSCAIFAIASVIAYAADGIKSETALKAVGILVAIAFLCALPATVILYPVHRLFSVRAMENARKEAMAESVERWNYAECPYCHRRPIERKLNGDEA